MNNWALPRHLLDNIKVTRTDDTTYFLFDTELAKSYRCAQELAHGIVTASKALELEPYYEFPLDRLTELAANSTQAKILVKYSCNRGEVRLDFYERD